MLQRVHDIEGLVMVTFVPSFVSEEARAHRSASEAEEKRFENEGLEAEEIKRRAGAWLEANPAPGATLQQVADHIDHLRDVAGIDHIGIGGDFDGITMVPRGLEDVSKYPDLLAELLHRGYSADDVAKVAGRNLLRVMYEVEVAGERIDASRDPSEARIEELDEREGAR